jgi:arylsulfatase
MAASSSVAAMLQRFLTRQCKHRRWIFHTIPFRISADETLDIGVDTGTPVSEDYQVPFKFTGDLKKVAIQLTDAALSPEDEAEIRRIRAEIGMSR